MQLELVPVSQEQVKTINAVLGAHQDITPEWANHLEKWLAWKITTPLTKEQITALKSASNGRYFLGSPVISSRDRRFRWDNIDAMAREIERILSIENAV